MTAEPDSAQPRGAQPLDDTFGISPLDYARRHQTLAILCLSLVMIVVAVSSLNVALPKIFRALNPSSSEQLWIVDSYALVFAGLLLPAGAIGDRFGRKGALMTGLVLFGLGSLAASQATSALVLIGMRSVMGIGAALVMPATLSIITNVFPPHERQKAIATWSGLAGAGGAIGPITSGTLLRWFEWESVFFINLPIVVLLLALVVFRVPTSKDPDGHALDPIGALLSVVALVGLVFGIIEGPHWGWGSAGVLGSFATAVIAGAAFVKWELTTPTPTLDPRLFRVRGFGMGSLSITFQFFGLFGMFFLNGLFLQFVLGYSPLAAGLAGLPFAVMMVAISPRSPVIVERFGVQNVIRGGYILMTLGFIGFATIATDTSYLHIAVALVLAGGGMALAMPPATGSIVSSLPLSKAGVGSAMNDVSREVGGAVGIALIGSIASTIYGSQMAERTAGAPVPAGIRPVIEDSIAKAYGVADRLAVEAGPATAELLRSAARDSFVHGARVAFWVAAGVALIAGLVVGAFIPDEISEGHRAGAPASP